MRVRDSSISIDKDAQRHIAQTVLLSQLIRCDHYWIVQLLFLHERLDYLPPSVVHRRSDNGEALRLILFLEVPIPGDFRLAAVAPGCPKIEQDHFPFVIREAHGGA